LLLIGGILGDDDRPSAPVHIDICRSASAVPACPTPPRLYHILTTTSACIDSARLSASGANDPVHIIRRRLPDRKLTKPPNPPQACSSSHTVSHARTSTNEKEPQRHRGRQTETGGAVACTFARNYFFPRPPMHAYRTLLSRQPAWKHTGGRGTRVEK
jgi:hypothetical protein